jgi:thioredoxin reductase
MLTGRLSHLETNYDVVIVGSGPAGMAAALGARAGGAGRILIVDREREAGGILNQCIHTGFGLHYFKEELTGPEYAQRFLLDIAQQDIDVLTDAFIADLCVDGAEKRIKLMSGLLGVRVIGAKAIVLAMGARERTRGAIRIPGSRPAGVLTAGLAQKFVNMLGLLPGRRVVILGSGDIGLIMARRLTLEGVEVQGVYEILPHPNGLNRNIVQCLQDFDIPLHLSTTVVNIHGTERVDRVTIAPVDAQLRPQVERSWEVPCDTLMLSIGLIPENELTRKVGAWLDPVTGGPVVDSTMQTTVEGVFACGNVVHIHDLVDFVSQESELAGRCAGEYVRGKHRPADNIKLVPGENVAYCVPHTISTDREHTIYMRVKEPLDKSSIHFGEVYEKKVRYVSPPETVTVTMRPRFLEKFHGDTLRVDARARV